MNKIPREKFQKKPELTIVIPARNEEKAISNLLEDIIANDYRNWEAIISDNGSLDGTAGRVFGYVSKYPEKIKLVYEGKKGVSAARNKGALFALGSYLAFIDVDARIPSDFLGEMVGEFKKKGFDIAVHYQKPDSQNILDKLYYGATNIQSFLLQKFSPTTPAGGIIVIKKELHERIGGFDELMATTQDQEYGIRASKKGKFGMLTHDKATFNVRRFEKEGRFNVWVKWLIQSINYRIIGKKYTKFPWSYH